MMWTTFVLALLSGVVFLYLPGYLAFRALRISKTISVAMAPMFTVPSYEILCIVYGNAGVFATWANVFFPILGVSAVCYGLSHVAAKHGNISREGCSSLGSKVELFGKIFSFDGLCLTLYVIVGVAFGCFLFLGNLASGPDGFSEAYDNIHHLGLIDGYLFSGDWSALHTTLYCGADAAFSTSPGVAFYPSGWHCLAAMAASFSGVPSTIAANAANFIFAFIAYPASMYAFMSTVFRGRPRAIAFGAIACEIIVAFPMCFLVFGPLYPNLAAYALVPAYAASFICFASFENKIDFRFLLAFVLGSLSMLFLQPNGVFTAAVLLIPYCVYQAFMLGAKGFRAKDGNGDCAFRKARGFVFSIAAIALICAIWYALYRAPFLQNVVQHTWPAYKGVLDAVSSVALYRFSLAGIQPAITLVVFVGFIATLKNKKYFWVSAALLIACAIYVVDVRIDGELQHLLGGFWYTDSQRIAAFIAIFSVPVAALGLDSVCSFVSGRARGKTISGPILVGVTSLCFVVLSFAPWVSIGDSGDWGMNAMQQRTNWLRSAYNNEQHVVYDPQERAFVKKVEEVVPEGEVVINEPNDGSAFAWAVDGLDVYNRNARVSDNNSPDSIIIRRELDHVASDVDVRRAVDNVGAKWVLVLDQGDGDAYSRLWSYEDGSDWSGIMQIEDSTPGFEVVLSEGDMRLYRISD